jgi:hypothetical protein
MAVSTFIFRIACVSLFHIVGSTIAAPTDMPLRKQQRFVCNTGYKVNECLRQLAILKAALSRYNAERLGAWKWVLVKSEDWSPILQGLHGNTDSPAFTILEKRQTFLEEALFAPVVARRAELLRTWSVPLNKLLELAITHELGHGICNTMDEGRADKFGQLLRDGKEPSC